MKITAIRIRKLVSRSVGYGHDAAEIEAQIEEGDDPDAVAAELHRRVDAEIRQGAERNRLTVTMTELYDAVTDLERQKERLTKQVEANRKAIREHEGLLELANERGIKLDGDLADQLIPF